MPTNQINALMAHFCKITTYLFSWSTFYSQYLAIGQSIFSGPLSISVSHLKHYWGPWTQQFTINHRYVHLITFNLTSSPTAGTCWGTTPGLSPQDFAIESSMSLFGRESYEDCINRPIGNRKPDYVSLIWVIRFSFHSFVIWDLNRVITLQSFWCGFDLQNISSFQTWQKRYLVSPWRLFWSPWTWCQLPG